jgi:hypothetical protein
MVPPIWVDENGRPPVPPPGRDGVRGWSTSTRFGWADLALWALLVVIVIALAVAGWWSTRDGKGP